MKRKITFLSAALMLLAFLAFPMGMRGQASVNTVLWGETWTGGSANQTPSDYGFSGTTIYGGTTITYAQSSTNTKLYADTLAGGTSPELLLSKSKQTWTIGNIPTGQATEMSLTFKSNKTTFAVTSTTDDINISGSQKSWTITATNTVSSFDLTIKNTSSSNARIDDVVLIVTTAGGGTSTPSITASNVNISYDAESGEIGYTINNPAGGELSANVTEGSWLYVGTIGEETVQFTCSANEANTAREGVITLTYAYGDNESVSKDVTITQDGAPVIYTTIPDIFAAATSTETNVSVTFDNWVVSGVSTNGKNVFVTDGTNGFVIFDNAGGLGDTYTVGDILSGTVSCSLKLYSGFAELLNVNADDLTINEGGIITTAEVAMADLTGVNTGALVHYDNLTCSVNNNKYYLSDGTTTLQVYNSLFAFEALENGKTYNITGVYQQYNTTKEVLPRSAEDIEEVTSSEPSITVTPATVSVNAEEHDGTLTIAYENLTITDMDDFGIQYYDAQDEEAEEPEWIAAEIAEQDPELGEGYVVSYLIEANEGEARTAYFKVWAMDDETNLVYSNLVTISQNAYVAPATNNNFVLFTGDLVEGDYVVYYNGNAMKNTVENNRLSYKTVTPENDVITTEDATIIWHIAPIGNYWTIYNSNANAYAASTGAKNKAQMLEDGTDDKALWTVNGTETFEFVNMANTAAGVNANLRNNGTYGFACYATSTGGALSLYKKDIEPETYTLDITGYGDNEGGYVLLASPVYANPTNTGMITDDGTDEENLTYDFYYFNQSQDLEWKNYRTKSFNIVPGKGYLYANKNNVDLTFAGTPYSGDGQIALTYDVNADFAGWNLIGNPFSYTANLSMNYYKLNSEGSEVLPELQYSSIEPMEGVFVYAYDEVMEEPIAAATFNAATAAANNPSKGITLNLTHNTTAVVDRAIVTLGEGSQLPKFQLNAENTKVYFSQSAKDYSVVRSDAQGEMPVNFKAAKKGTYTISINTENVEMEYLHLIDNLTGADVDLLHTPNYTFDANTTDYASRFRLVFSANDVEESTDSDSFAFFNGSEWIISNMGNATLQMVDMTGRILSSESISGNATVSTANLSTGIYMMRLVNSENVKTQKVVVK